MRKRNTAWVGLVVFCLTPPAWGDEKYTMADLEALGESEGWSELLAHAQDVRPSLRKKKWKRLLQSAAVGHLDVLVQQKKPHAAVQEADQILVQFPMLKKSKEFMDKRGEVGLASAEDCFRNTRSGVQCVQQLRDFVATNADNTDLAFKAGKLVREIGRMHKSAPEFLVVGLGPKKTRAARCKDESVAGSVFMSFGAPSEYTTTKAAVKIAFEYCYADFKDRLLSAFYNSSGYESRNLCRGLKKRRAKLTAFQTAYCKDQLDKEKAR